MRGEGEDVEGLMMRLLAGGGQVAERMPLLRRVYVG